MATSSSGDDGFFSFFKSLPQKSDTTIRFFNKTDYYSVYGADAVFAAKEVFKSTNNIKYIGPARKPEEQNSQENDEKIESLAINKNQFANLVRDLLLVRQYRVEVYNGTTLEYKGSPGNLTQFEDLIFGLDIVAGGTVMAVKMGTDSKTRTLGVCTVGVDDRLLSVCHLDEDEGFTGLEGLIVQLSPKEVIVPDGGDYKQVAKVASRCGSMIVIRKPADFSAEGLADDLNRLLVWKDGQAENSMGLPEMQLGAACGALNAAIKYLELSRDEANFHQFSLETLRPQQYVHVDSSASRALGLSGGPGSLLSHLDRCRTAHGRRALAGWLRQPLRDIARINDRLDVVAALVADHDLRMSLSDDHLRRFPDLQLLARRLQRNSSNLQDCYKVYQAVQRLPPLLDSLNSAFECVAMRDMFINPLRDLSSDMEKFQAMVESTIDMEAVDRGEFMIRMDFCEDLTAFRKNMDELTDAMERELNNTARMLGLEAGKSIKLDSNAQIGYFFRSTNKKQENSISNHPNLRLIDGTKAAVRFRSDKLTKLSSEYTDAKAEYDECQKSLVSEILNIAASYISAILSLSQVIAHLDVLTSFAVVSSNAPTPFTRPVVLPSTVGVLRLIQARHPVMECLDSVAFIPNDIKMAQDDTSFHIVTGPNMGGKSTYLRTVGTCSILAHIGCFVPCDEAELSCMDAILARIGAGDCQIAGLSTFMNEMVETAAILRRATQNSLVLIDELGRGTSTYEGCGLAWSIAKHLAEETKAFSLFATHFQELTCLPDEVKSAANFHVSAVASEMGLTLLYQVLPGPSDRSFGLEVARMAQLPQDIIDVAKEKLVELEQQQGLGISGVNLTPDEIQCGEIMVLEFLRRLQEVEEGKLSTELPKLREELMAQNNRYIQAILS